MTSVSSNVSEVTDKIASGSRLLNLSCHPLYQFVQTAIQLCKLLYLVQTDIHLRKLFYPFVQNAITACATATPVYANCYTRLCKWLYTFMQKHIRVRENANVCSCDQAVISSAFGNTNRSKPIPVSATVYRLVLSYHRNQYRSFHAYTQTSLKVLFFM